MCLSIKKKSNIFYSACRFHDHFLILNKLAPLKESADQGFCVCVCTVISHQDDIDTAIESHLFQAIHQLADDPVNHPQRDVHLEPITEHSYSALAGRIV